MTLPLAGLLVVTIEQAVAAPLCTARLSDAGARVIKIERIEGDFARRYDNAALGDSSYFAWINHGKESIALDFKTTQDADLLHRIIAKADVLVQNLAPGALSRAGFDFAKLRERHRRLVTCSVSGYGDSPAMAGMKAYDLLVQAESGLISVSGGPGELGRIGVSLCDIGAGVTAYTGILEALLRRSITGKGGHVDVSLFGVSAEWMSVPFLHAAYGSGAPEREGLKHPSIAPYGAFSDSSGTLTLLSIQNEREWQRLCLEVLQAPFLFEDASYTSNDKRVLNRQALDASIESITSRMNTKQFRDALKGASIAFGGLNSVNDLLTHDALVRRRVINSDGQAVSMPAHPVLHVEGIEGAESAASAEDTQSEGLPRVPSINEQGESIRNEFLPIKGEAD